MLENIHSPEDIRGYNKIETENLCKELRETILETVAKNGGHLASNLGIVEATVALHRVFHSPEDKIIFDVGHQCYAHKILTGRYDQFSTLRKMNGISGFTNPMESDHDLFYEGHCGTALSSALGIAMANKMQGKKDYTVAIVGDGAFTNGMVFEALNNCSDQEGLNLILLLNDNEMSISKNVGGLPKHLDRMRTSQGYYTVKHTVSGVLSHLPLLSKIASRTKNFMKRQVLKYNLFESMGVDYIGPVDGNNVEKLEVVFKEAKKRRKVCVIHMVTKKGKGYSFAEENPAFYHGIGAFDLETGAKPSVGLSDTFGEVLLEEGRKNDKICAVTAAMADGTGLVPFSKEFPDRFFDVGIAEEHAVTFSAGLSKSGYLPVFAVYSTFAQRIYDQVWHDIALQNLPFVLCLDRSGFVPGDGITHQGLFDVSLFSSIPHAEIYSPESEADLRTCLQKAFRGKGLSIVRYPKGKGGNTELTDHGDFFATEGIENEKNVLVTYGRVTKNALNACKKAGFGLVKLVKIFPVPTIPLNAERVYLLEEGVKAGGIMEKISATLSVKTKIHAIEDFQTHGSLDELYARAEMDEESLTKKLIEFKDND